MDPSGGITGHTIVANRGQGGGGRRGGGISTWDCPALTNPVESWERLPFRGAVRLR